MEKTTVKLYRHYKNKLYKLLGVVKHSETLEDYVLYKPLENNLDDQLWVRPKDMFFEKILKDDQKIFRFEPVVFKYTIFKELDPKIKDSLYALATSVFKDLDEDFLEERLLGKKNVLIQVATDNQLDDSFKIIGFKIGYEKTNEIFYSWLGAVDPEYRNLGIGLELAKQQHSWCETMGFKYLETKTLNRWKSMLLMNLKLGFDIVGTEYCPKNEFKILLQKKIF